MALKVAVIGMSDSCESAPWADPSWEKWGLPWHDGKWAQMDRLFEMHDIRQLVHQYSDGYFERLCECGVPLYMQEADADLGAMRYPIEEVSASVGRCYFTSSIAYMLALAIHECAESIALYGVDINENKYGFQRPCIEYLIGVAAGRGIAVMTQESSALFTYEPTDGYIGRYGWLG